MRSDLADCSRGKLLGERVAPGCRPRDWRREGRIAVLTVWVRAVGKVRVPSRPTSRAKKVGLQGLPWTRKHITIAVAVAQGGLATCGVLNRRELRR